MPAWDKHFAALTLSPEQVKVVILGQDPYPNADHGIGLAFAVPSETKPLPGSLRNILKEVETDIGRAPRTSAGSCALGRSRCATSKYHFDNSSWRK